MYTERMNVNQERTATFVIKMIVFIGYAASIKL